MELKNLSKRVQVMWQLRNVFWLLVMSVGCAIALLIAFETAAFTAVAVIAGGVWVVLAVLLVIWPRLAYKKYTYGYDDKRFYIHHGVIFKHQITAPMCQIQDLHVYQGPIMRLFAVSKIIFATGGSNFELTGLDAAIAPQIVAEVEEYLRARVEGNRHEEI